MSSARPPDTASSSSGGASSSGDFDMPSSVVDAIETHTAEMAERRLYTWLRMDGGEEATLTFRQLRDGAQTVCCALRRRWHVADGDRVMLIYPPGLEFNVAFFGCQYAGVVAVPLFRRLGLGSVLGYFTAGLAIGPYGVGLFPNPESVLHVAELGVVMFLFIIGLEMQPSRLWNLRREIFGLGVSQVVLCGTLLTGVGYAYGVPLPAAKRDALAAAVSLGAMSGHITVRKGEIGDWKNHLSDEEWKLVDDTIAETVAGSQLYEPLAQYAKR